MLLAVAVQGGGLPLLRKKGGKTFAREIFWILFFTCAQHSIWSILLLLVSYLALDRPLLRRYLPLVQQPTSFVRPTTDDVDLQRIDTNDLTLQKTTIIIITSHPMTNCTIFCDDEE